MHATVGRRAITSRGHTHSQQFESVESLPRDHRDELRFAEEGHFGRREAGRERKRHRVSLCMTKPSTSRDAGVQRREQMRWG